MAVTWKLGEHTVGKHLVLRRYLDAWFPILGMRQKRILVIDGFAGPGEYSGGEPGSPLIAMRALRDHPALARFKAEVVFLFVESEKAHATHLRTIVTAEAATMPPRTQVIVENGKFDATINSVLDQVEANGQQLVPTFLMADPFGVSGTPLSVIARVLRNPKSEVYVSFMYEAINRHKHSDEFPPHLDGLFGTSDWRAGIDIADPAQKKKFFFSLYRDQLKAAGAKQVVHFELYRGNRLIYAIFFGTQHSKGCDMMKQAIWGVAPFGDYAFRGAGGDQLGLGLGQPDLARFGRELQIAFLGQGWVLIERILEYAQSDQTAFHSGQVKPALRLLEKSGALVRHAGDKARRGTFPAGTRVRLAGGSDL